MERCPTCGGSRNVPLTGCLGPLNNYDWRFHGSQGTYWTRQTRRSNSRNTGDRG